MNMFKPTTAKTPEEYIALIDEPRRSQIQQIHDFIRKTVPGLKPYIAAGMIGYGVYHYRYASGREGDWAIVALASQKNYISVYVCATDGTAYLAEKKKDTLGKASVGKSCIRYKKLEDINWSGLEAILKEAAVLMKNTQ